MVEELDVDEFEKVCVDVDKKVSDMMRTLEPIVRSKTRLMALLCKRAEKKREPGQYMYVNAGPIDESAIAQKVLFVLRRATWECGARPVAVDKDPHPLAYVFLANIIETILMQHSIIVELGEKGVQERILEKGVPLKNEALDLLAVKKQIAQYRKIRTNGDFFPFFYWSMEQLSPHSGMEWKDIVQAAVEIIFEAVEDCLEGYNDELWDPDLPSPEDLSGIILYKIEAKPAEESNPDVVPKVEVEKEDVDEDKKVVLQGVGQMPPDHHPAHRNPSPSDLVDDQELPALDDLEIEVPQLARNESPIDKLIDPAVQEFDDGEPSPASSDSEVELEPEMELDAPSAPRPAQEAVVDADQDIIVVSSSSGAAALPESTTPSANNDVIVALPTSGAAQVPPDVPVPPANQHYDAGAPVLEFDFGDLADNHVDHENVEERAEDVEETDQIAANEVEVADEESDVDAVEDAAMEAADDVAAEESDEEEAAAEVAAEDTFDEADRNAADEEGAAAVDAVEDTAEAVAEEAADDAVEDVVEDAAEHSDEDPTEEAAMASDGDSDEDDAAPVPAILATGSSHVSPAPSSPLLSTSAAANSSAPVKRGRGRPKNRPGPGRRPNYKKKKYNGPKRGRGRPRKPLRVPPPTDGTRRGRGRPKNLVPPGSVAPPARNPTGPPRRKRSPPPPSDRILRKRNDKPASSTQKRKGDDLARANGAPAAKRGRGRPRKQQK